MSTSKPNTDGQEQGTPSIPVAGGEISTAASSSRLEQSGEPDRDRSRLLLHTHPGVVDFREADLQELLGNDTASEALLRQIESAVGITDSDRPEVSIARQEALDICAKNFPRGPEKVAEALCENGGLEVVSLKEPTLEIDGWCIAGPSATFVTLNRNKPESRQRFTLAHELAHLIRGTTPDLPVGPSKSSARTEKSREELEVNNLAGRLLIPEMHLDRLLNPHPVVDMHVLKRVKEKSLVSTTMAATRIVSHFDKQDRSAFYLWFKDNSLESRFGRGVFIDEEKAETLRSRTECGVVKTIQLEGSEFLVSSEVSGDHLFIFGHENNGESPKNSESYLRQTINDAGIRPSVEGCLGTFIDRFDAETFDAAWEEFRSKYSAYEKYLDRTNQQVCETVEDYWRRRLEEVYADQQLTE